MLYAMPCNDIGQEREINMYECFHCGKRAVVWDSDFSFDEMGYEGEGIVHICHCSECGAEIEYKVSLDWEMDGVFNEVEDNE